MRIRSGPVLESILMMSATQLIGWTLVVSASVVGIAYHLTMFAVSLVRYRRRVAARRLADAAVRAASELGPLAFVLAFAALEIAIVARGGV